VRRVKVVVTKVRKNKHVEARRAWKKFGDCQGSAPGVDPSVTIASYDDVTIERKKKIGEDEPAADPWKALAAPSNNQMVCRLCGAVGEHMFLKCPKRKTMNQADIDAKVNGGAAPSEPGQSSSSSSGLGGSLGSLGSGSAAGAAAGGKYVAPRMRAGAAAGGSSMSGGDSVGGAPRDEFPTLRVTNLSEEAEEDDIRDLFSNFGRVNRCFIGRDRDTGRSKGFAYVSFYVHGEAQTAMEKLNGYGYDNLILRIDWAEKRKPM
jgi:translation initiation factor 3 subunit G